MSLFSTICSRRRSPSLLLLRHLSTTSSASAKNKLRKVFDPDEAVSILTSSDPSSSSSRFALDLAVRRLSRSRRFSDVHSLLQSRIHSHPHPNDEPFLSSLILTYATARMLSHARQLFDQIPHPTSTSFNALLSAHVRAKQHNSVPDLFLQLPIDHPSIVPDATSYSILIKSSCIAGDVDNAMQAFAEMKHRGLLPNLITYTTLIDCFYKNKKSEEARRLWTEMVGCGLKPDLVAYNVKAMDSSDNGKPEDVLEVIREVEMAGLKPDAITYNYLITCYCRSGRFAEAKEAYSTVFEKSVAPNAAMFKMLVASLCRKGDFDWGVEVFRDSVKHNRIPDFRTLKCLVEGLVKEGKAEGAKEVIREVKARFPEGLTRKWDMLEQQLGLSRVAEEIEVIS